jgi:regulator of RNase E activity RraA
VQIVGKPGFRYVPDFERPPAGIVRAFKDLMQQTGCLTGNVGDSIGRDAAEIRALGFPLFARGINPNGPSKEGPGEINFPISCGGKIVNPGDIIVADDDGVVVVPKRMAETALKEAQAVIQKEAGRDPGDQSRDDHPARTG